jgi:hypothetical protein
MTGGVVLPISSFTSLASGELHLRWSRSCYPELLTLAITRPIAVEVRRCFVDNNCLSASIRLSGFR